MPEPSRVQQVADAFAAALADGFTAWRREHAAAEDPELAWAQFVKRIELNAQFSPGKRGFCTVEVVDRRPGRSTLHSYSLQPAPQRTGLQRHAAKS